MSDSTPKFTAEEKGWLATIRDDIAARPDFYRTGIDYLRRRFSADALHAADMQTWAEFNDHPTQIASSRATAARTAWEWTWPDDEPDERDRIERDVYNQLSAAPDKGRGYRLSNCLVHAFSTLLHERLDTPDDDLNPHDVQKCKAVLGLTWLLTDKNANLHPLGEPFGPWLAGQHEYAELSPTNEFALQIAAKGRAMARVATLDELNGECRARWMELAKTAWKVVQAATAHAAVPGSATRASSHPDNAPVQPLKVVAGKDGRRNHVQDRYQQLAQERDSAGRPVYPSQQMIIRKLGEELSASERTLKEDIKWLRNQKRLPPLPKRAPKEVTNRMGRINPTRSTPM